MKNASQAVKPANYDIIDDILNSKESAFEGKKAPKNLAHITASNFFTKENIGGPITKEEWLKVIRLMSKLELRSLDAFLAKLSDGESIFFTPLVRPDDDGRNHLWVTFKYKKGTQTFKVFTFGEFCKFLVMYQTELLTVDLSLEALYTEATK